MKLFLFILSLFMFSCSTKSESQCGFIRNRYGERISWKKLPVKMYIHESVPKEFHEAIYFSASAWNKAAGKNVIEVEGITKDINTLNKEGTNTISFSNIWSKEKPNEQGYTRVYWIGDSITETDIFINNKNFQFYSGNMGYTRKVNIESLMIHEMGHALGLSHNPNRGSTMDAYLAIDEERMKVTEETIQYLKCEY